MPKWKLQRIQILQIQIFGFRQSDKNSEQCSVDPAGPILGSALEIIIITTIVIISQRWYILKVRHNVFKYIFIRYAIIIIISRMWCILILRHNISKYILICYAIMIKKIRQGDVYSC